MSHTLLLRLQGPMQAWGVQSHFSVRETTREPTKSGVIGLLCAALGRDRATPLNDLASLRMGARVDREGQLMVDFHTAREALNAQGKVLRNAVLSTRYYLADAVFLVGLEHAELTFLQSLQTALRSPCWILCLGRRSFPPAAPVWLKDGLREGETLETALKTYPWLVREPRSAWERERLPGQLRFTFEDEPGEVTRNDAPISFAQRTFAGRPVKIRMAAPPSVFIKDLAGG